MTRNVYAFYESFLPPSVLQKCRIVAQINGFHMVLWHSQGVPRRSIPIPQAGFHLDNLFKAQKVTLLMDFVPTRRLVLKTY